MPYPYIPPLASRFIQVQIEDISTAGQNLDWNRCDSAGSQRLDHFGWKMFICVGNQRQEFRAENWNW